MAIQNRTTTLPGIWASNAQTTIPTPPVAGVTYRDTTLNSTAIDKAWPFKTIVDSSDFNQHAFLQDTLIKEAEQYGIMRWNNTTTYKEGGFCLGQDGRIYQAIRDNQGKEPTENTDDWKIPFAIDSDIVHKTGNETISGIKTFTDNIKAPNQKQIAYENIREVNCSGETTVILQDTDEIIVLQINENTTITIDTSQLTFPNGIYTVQFFIWFPNGLKTISLSTSLSGGFKYINGIIPNFSTPNDHWLVARKAGGWPYLILSDAGVVI